MFRNLRLKRTPDEVIIDPSALTREWLAKDADTPIRLGQINDLPDSAKKRIYRSLLPADLLTRFDIDPITWQGLRGEEQVELKANPDSSVVHISVSGGDASPEEFYRLEIGDNSYNGIDIHLLLLNDPNAESFRTDIDDQGRPTSFGTVRRNLEEEQRAMRAGLAPGQIRISLGASKIVFQLLDSFFMTLGQRSYFFEPLTYASAWVFERRGCAYVRGHKLMDHIHKEFQPGGALYKSLDGRSPFRQSDQWNSVRGRAWAIQDGILEAVDEKWDNLRMIKQVGRHAGVETYPDAIY